MTTRTVSISFSRQVSAGFAVVNVVTTGFMPETHDRVLEVAVVLVSESGEVQDEWSTLVNPHRDPGAIHLHGIASRELIAAPDFGEVAALLLESIDGRTVVAHNASFGMRFVHHELLRAGYDVDDRPPALCTMKWAGRFVGPAKLEHCCSALDIALDHKYHALPAARATAELLRYLLQQGRSLPEWQNDAANASASRWPHTGGERGIKDLKARGAAEAASDSWMAAVLESTWIAGSPENEAAYMLALDSALLDRYVSAAEGEHLIQIAGRSGLSHERIMGLHANYLVEMSKIALDDDVVTEDERLDLERVAHALGLRGSDVDAALSLAAEFRLSATDVDVPGVFLSAGDRVVFTGEMSRDRDSWISLIVDAGLASGGVTKSTRLLVSADPDSMSGKAGKARGYGVPVVDEPAFERLFAEYCSLRVSV